MSQGFGAYEKYDIEVHDTQGNEWEFEVKGLMPPPIDGLLTILDKDGELHVFNWANVVCYKAVKA